MTLSGPVIAVKPPAKLSLRAEGAAIPNMEPGLLIRMIDGCYPDLRSMPVMLYRRYKMITYIKVVK